jgi:hypothetical protein
VRSRTPFFRRLVPWEALAPGGPPRPELTADQLRLVVTQPERVVQRGLVLGWGSRQYPCLALDVNVHPIFVADAIRWYVEHPEDRAGIGTPAGHDRLLANLGVTAHAVA